MGVEGDDVNVSEWSLGAAGVLDVIRAALLFARYCLHCIPGGEVSGDRGEVNRGVRWEPWFGSKGMILLTTTTEGQKYVHGQ